jgi:hypothetical protein
MTNPALVEVGGHRLLPFGPATVYFTTELASRGKVFLSTIVEGPYEWKVRSTAEIAYDREAGRRETSSALIGVIWQIRDNIALDSGIREGRTNILDLTSRRFVPG